MKATYMECWTAS